MVLEFPLKFFERKAVIAEKAVNLNSFGKLYEKF